MGRDARILTNSALDYQKSPYLVDTDDYEVDIQPVRSMEDRQTKYHNSQT